MNCVIVIPIYKEVPNEYERISLNRCKKILGKYPIRLLTPKGLDIAYYDQLFEGISDFGNVVYPEKYFKSPQTYNKFMTSKATFMPFENYEYLLMYHTDAYVFKDELVYWCKKGYDYIGAPLFAQDGTISPQRFIGVGNGGFSLMKLSSVFRVLNARKRLMTFKELKRKYLAYNLKGRILKFPIYFLLALGIGNTSHYRTNKLLNLNEDWFWGFLVSRAFDWYKVAPFEEAYKFSMEYNCEHLYKINNCTLPFGCHLWFKKEFLSFWKDKLHLENHDVHLLTEKQ